MGAPVSTCALADARSTLRSFSLRGVEVAHLADHAALDAGVVNSLRHVPHDLLGQFVF